MLALSVALVYNLPFCFSGAVGELSSNMTVNPTVDRQDRRRGNKIVQRQDSSPTRFLKTVH